MCCCKRWNLCHLLRLPEAFWSYSCNLWFITYGLNQSVGVSLFKAHKRQQWRDWLPSLSVCSLTINPTHGSISLTLFESKYQITYYGTYFCIGTERQRMKVEANRTVGNGCPSNSKIKTPILFLCITAWLAVILMDNYFYIPDRQYE